MSRLTGTDAYGLMEAYGAVYAPQELTEEQVWEEVEEWVNTLIEEGYDLSDYTWEEMFEAYIEEQGGRGGAAIRNSSVSQNPAANYLRSIPNPLTMNAGGQVRRPMASMGPNYKEQEIKASQAANRSQIGTSRQGSAGGNSGLSNIPPPKPAKDVVVKAALKGQPGTLNKTTGKFTASTPPTKPTTTAATPAPRPTATAAAPKPAAAPAATTPTAPKPATGMLGKTSFERRTPTSAELKAAQASRAGGEKNPEKVLQAAKAASTPKPAATPATGNTLSQTTAAASKPAAFSPTPAATPAAKPPLKKPIAAGFDMFDVVKGYLIGEGYADTEEAALAIMTNMSEEWKQSIIKSI